jgi:hypothetical protein
MRILCPRANYSPKKFYNILARGQKRKEFPCMWKDCKAKPNSVSKVSKKNWPVL